MQLSAYDGHKEDVRYNDTLPPVKSKKQKNNKTHVNMTGQKSTVLKELVLANGDLHCVSNKYAQ